MGYFDQIIDDLSDEIKYGVKIHTQRKNPFSNFSRRQINNGILLIDNSLKNLTSISSLLKNNGFIVESFFNLPPLDDLAMNYQVAIMEIDYSHMIMNGPLYYQQLRDGHFAKHYIIMTKSNPFKKIYVNGYESHPHFKTVNEFKKYVEDYEDNFFYKDPSFWPPHYKNHTLPTLIMKLIKEKIVLKNDD